MKKNTLALIIGLLLIVAIAFILLKRNNAFSGTNDFNEFAIEDTAAITSIFIADKTGDEITLVKNEEGIWHVKNKFEARKDAVHLLLKTFKQLELYSTVPKDAYETVLKNLASVGKKVEVYKDNSNEPFKTYYIGSATTSRMGTYALLEINGKMSDIPYIVYVTTENGSIGSRFFTDDDLWRDRAVFTYNPKAIRSIEVRHFNDTMGSFKIWHRGNAEFEIENLASGEVFPLSREQGINYYSKFSNVHYEYLDKKTPQSEMDSIYLSQPRNIITIIDTNGNSHVAKTFFMPVKRDATDYQGNPVSYNPERMYLKSNKIDLNMVVQNYVFNQLIPGFEDFDLSTDVEK